MNFNISKMVYSKSFQTGRIQPKNIVKKFTSDCIYRNADLNLYWLWQRLFHFSNNRFIYWGYAWPGLTVSLLQVLLRDGVCLLSEYKGAQAKTFLSDTRQPEVGAFSFRLKMQKVYFRLTFVALSSLFSNLPCRLSKNDGKWLVHSWLLSLVKL